VAVELTTTDVEFPKFDGWDGQTPILSGVRLTDRDVILARQDVAVSDPAAALYSNWFGPHAPVPVPIPVDVYRGWSAVTATVDGRDIRFVNTHLESEDQQGLHAIRSAQAYELMLVLGAEALPLIVVGDFNSGPGRPVSEDEVPAYSMMLDGGYMDLWSDGISPKGRGDTCCHAGDLSNRKPMMDQRIDLVLYRNFELGRRSLAWSSLVNEKRQDLVRHGTWSSDHAGVISWLVFP
jgi:endonuclease/exonuclease/phosphatase family metal-dependent hydrolase